MVFVIIAAIVTTVPTFCTLSMRLPPANDNRNGRPLSLSLISLSPHLKVVSSLQTVFLEGSCCGITAVFNGHAIAIGAGEIMSDQQSICSICGSPLMDIIIDYSDWSGGHLIVVRDVPIRECEDNGHRFFQAKIARSLEKLLEAEKQEEIVPIEIMEVPVFKLPVAV